HRAVAETGQTGERRADERQLRQSVEIAEQAAPVGRRAGAERIKAQGGVEAGVASVGITDDAAELFPELLVLRVAKAKGELELIRGLPVQLPESRLALRGQGVVARGPVLLRVRRGAQDRRRQV